MNIFLFFWQKQLPVFKANAAVKIAGRLFVLFVACAAWMPSQGQQAKSPVQLADQYFAAGEYYTAAHLYGQVLDPAKKQITGSDFPLNSKRRRMTAGSNNISRSAILLKQAESYRLANYWQQAADAYKEYAGMNPAQNAEALYWYAVCQRSLGNYTVAEESLKQASDTAGTGTPHAEVIEKELQTLLYIRQQLARPDSVLINTGKLNAANGKKSGMFAPVHISGDQFLVTSTETDTVQVNGVNPYHSRLFYASLSNDSLKSMVPAMIAPGDQMNNQGAAGISADGNYLYFSQWRKENGGTVSSIYYAVKQGVSWSLPTLLPSGNLEGYNSKQPFCSSDGKYLFFASDRPGGSGKFDIWYAPLKNDGTIAEPVNAGTVVNTSGDEQAPFYHGSSATLVFSSNGRQGMGGYDLFSAKGSETIWKMPENMGHPINSPRDDIYFFAPEKSPLLGNAIFSSDRGEGCCLETYWISKAPKSKLLTGLLRDCADNMPVAGAEVVLKDGSGKKWIVTTGSDGKYVFELPGDTYQDLGLSVNKELYKETISAVNVENTDESDLLTDKLTNADLCIERKPEEKPVEEKLVIKAEDVVTVYFDFDRSDLKAPAINKLDSIYNVMVEYPAATIQISGYTDGLGSIEYNNRLSDKRARACAAYLVKKGVEATRISFVSFGACCPVEMELINGRDNPDGRSRNRRALINVKKE